MSHFGRRRKSAHVAQAGTLHFQPYRQPPARPWLDALGRGEVKEPIRLTIVDPGTVKFALRIEERIVGQTKSLAFHVFNAAKYAAEHKITVFDAVNEHLEHHHELLEGCHGFFAEHTFDKNHEVNRVAQVALDYFCRIARDSPRFPLVQEVSDKLKYKAFGVPSRKPKADWVPSTAEALLIERGEADLAEMMMRIPQGKGRIDLGDTVVLGEAVVADAGWECLLPTPE